MCNGGAGLTGCAGAQAATDVDRVLPRFAVEDHRRLAPCDAGAETLTWDVACVSYGRRPHMGLERTT